MLLFEHEGKAVLREHGIATPHGMLAENAADVAAAAAALAPPFMVKSQVLAGGRGKAGGIRAAADANELRREAEAMLGRSVRDLRVRTLLVEERVIIQQERYMALVLDGEQLLLVLGRQGGVEVEELFSGARDGFQLVKVDPAFGLSAHQVRVALEDLGIPPQWWAAYCEVAERLARLFRRCDATLAEINPLAELGDGKLVAVDARIVIDDGALFRQAKFAAMAKTRMPPEGVAARMQALEIQYVPIGGSIGLISSGAGVGTTVMDWVAREGGRLHSFVDLDYAIMSGHTESGIALILDTLLGDATVKAIIVNFTTCGLRLDEIARALVKALDAQRSRVAVPIFVHLQGNRASLGHALVREAGYDVVDKLGDAVRKAARAALKGRA
ncbi:MAG TPA: ATP-grasp domain-containing protein [Hyphomicrobiaceae bacterium]|nr:ATP-grasp domain-containing protein [Hyphomicrobiaceae bacterium]